MKNKNRIRDGLSAGILGLALCFFQGCQPRPSQPVPVFILGINDSSDRQWEQGVPLIAKLTVMAPLHQAGSGKKEKLSLKGKDFWGSLFRIETTDGQGEKQSWTWEMLKVSDPKPELILGPGEMGILTWVLSPESVSKIKAGDYQITPLLNTGKEEIRGEAIKIKILPRQEKSTGPSRPDSAKVLARYHFLRSENSEALQVLNQEIKARPGDSGLLAFQGDVLVEMGKKKEALKSYEDALMAGDEREPDPALYGKYRKLWHSMAKERAVEYDPKKLEVWKGPLPQVSAAAPSKSNTENKTALLPEASLANDPLKENSPAPAESFVPMPVSEIEPAPEKFLAREGEIRMVLSWVEPVDVDLKIEDEQGEKVAGVKDVSKGPGQEEWIIPTSEITSSKYYAAASLAGFMGTRASVKASLTLPGQAPVELTQELIYDGEHQHWIAFVLHTENWKIEKANTFEVSIAEYRKKNGSTS